MIEDDIGKILIDFKRILSLQTDAWIIDSGATDHFVKSPDSVKGTAVPSKRGIRTATGHVTYSSLMGDILLYLAFPDGSSRKTVLTNVLYVPEVEINLLGTIRLGKKGLGVNLLPDCVIISNVTTNEIVGYGDMVGSTYVLRTVQEDLAIKQMMPASFLAKKSTTQVPPTTPVILSTPSTHYVLKDQPLCGAFVDAMKKDRVNLFTWHRRFAHLSIPNVIRVSKMVDGMDIKSLSVPKHVCKSCRQADAVAMQGYQKITPAICPGHRVFVDIGGGHIDMPDATGSGARYWLLIVDQYEGWVSVRLLKNKSHAWRQLQIYIDEEDRAGCKVQIMHSDEGGEFTKRDLQKGSANLGKKQGNQVGILCPLCSQSKRSS